MKDKKLNFKNKKIALCVTGSISAYKSASLASEWTQKGASVHVLLTESAKKFIGKSTFEGITHNKVLDSLWDNNSDSNIDHLDISKTADIIVIAPATANIISKIAGGICDDIISTSVIATNKPVLIAPAMDGNMYDHFAVKTNVDTLKKNGVIVMEPEEGYLASGAFGKGRLHDLDSISNEINRILGIENKLKNIKILVSAGGTKEPIDSVRYIGNRSSGKMGHLIAEEGLMRGADVTLVSSSSLITPSKINKISVQTADEMANEIKTRIKDTDCIIMAAAVSDFTPEIKIKNKIKKQSGKNLELSLKQTPDILKSIEKNKCIKIGFAAETENHLDNGINKLKAKNLDMVVINDVSNSQIGFESDYNQVKMITKNGNISSTEIEPKRVIAGKILDELSKIIK